MPYQWLSPDERHMHGTMSFDEIEDTLHECVSTEVSELAERHSPAQMLIFIRIAAGAA
jgi:hypothetical protein